MAFQPYEDLKEHVGTLATIIAFLTLTIVGMLKGWWTDTAGKLKGIEDRTKEKFEYLEKRMANETEDIWDEVNQLKQNQLGMVSKTDWQELNHERISTLQRIEGKLDGFIESCRKGECARGGDRG